MFSAKFFFDEGLNNLLFIYPIIPLRVSSLPSILADLFPMPYSVSLIHTSQGYNKTGGFFYAEILVWYCRFKLYLALNSKDGVLITKGRKRPGPL